MLLISPRRLETLRSKLENASSRLDERRLFDENLNNKFDTLTKELNEMRLLQSIGGVASGENRKDDSTAEGKGTAYALCCIVALSRSHLRKILLNRLQRPIGAMPLLLPRN